MFAQAAHENCDGRRRISAPGVEVRPAELAEREGGAEVAMRCSATSPRILIILPARFGFLYDGTFYENRVVRGRNRDTGGAAHATHRLRSLACDAISAWFSITSARWQSVAQAFDAWLSAENFDSAGLQKQQLSDMTLAT
jgi:hypothetical protein